MQPIKLEDFLQFKSLARITYSPAGKQAAAIVTTPAVEKNSYHQHIWLCGQGGERPLVQDKDVADFIWDDSETVLYALKEAAAKEGEVGEVTEYRRRTVADEKETEAFCLPVRATRIRRLARGLYLVSAICDANYPDYYRMTTEERKAVEQEKEENKDYEVMDELPFWANARGFINKLRNRLFIYEEATEKLTALSGPLFETAAVAVSDSYVLFAGEEYAQKAKKRAKLYRYDWKTGECKCIYDEMKYFVEDLEAVGDQFVMVGSTYERYGIEENYCFYLIDPEKGEPQLLADADIYINNSVVCDCRYGEGRNIRGTEDELYFITTQAKTAELYKLSLTGEISKVITREGSVDDFDVYGDDVLLVGLYDMKIQEIYHFSMKDQVMTQVTHFNEEVMKDKYVAQPRHITFYGHGIALDGWVLEPKDYDENKTYPGLLTIHGGPRMTYSAVYYHEMHVWASAGFFVFFCNPEGSSGCGNEFGDLRGKYGTIDYEDLMTFTDVVLEKYPQIDRNRLGVVGGSYGGFMTNWIIGHTNRFAAAASQRSISNWVSFYGYSDIGPWFGLDQQAATPFDGVERMWEHSPLKYADKVTTPTLFIHSDEDYRCGMPEGIQMYTALVDRGVPVRFCYFYGENHGLSRNGKPKHRVRRLQEITNWFFKYLGDQN